MNAPVTLHRAINALGGVPADEYERGFNTAIGVVLGILERRGFTEAADGSVTDKYRALCAKHGLVSAGVIYHARQGTCASFVVAYAQAYGECHTAIGETAEDALAAAIAKADAHRLKFEAMAQIAALDAGTMKVAAV